jgi:MFS family permease
LSGTGYGLLLGCSSIGVILGGAVAPRVHHRLGTGWALLGAGLLAGLAYPILALTHSVVVATGALLVETAMVVVGNTASRSLRQGLVPAEMQGRSTSVYLCTILGSYPLGALLGGLLVSRYSFQGAFSTAGILQLAVISVVGPRLLASLRVTSRMATIDLREASPTMPEHEPVLTAEAN